MILNELKNSIIQKVADTYFCNPIDDILKSRILCDIRSIITEALIRNELSEEPKDLRIVQYESVLLVMNGEYALSDWLDKVWNSAVYDIKYSLKCTI